MHPKKQTKQQQRCSNHHKPKNQVNFRCTAKFLTYNLIYFCPLDLLMSKTYLYKINGINIPLVWHNMQLPGNLYSMLYLNLKVIWSISTATSSVSLLNQNWIKMPSSDYWITNLCALKIILFANFCSVHLKVKRISNFLPDLLLELSEKVNKETILNFCLPVSFKVI